MTLQVTEKTDAYMDNLRVGLELWEKQLMVGGEVDSWAGSKLAMFAESHPFHNEQQVLDMKVRLSYCFTATAQKGHVFSQPTSFTISSMYVNFSLLRRMRSTPMKRTLSISIRSL